MNARARRGRGVWRAAAAVLLGLLAASAAAGAAGFFRFVQVAEGPAAPPPHADGIVVLTGGADRVETGLRLLADGQAERLLVSGVGRGSELPELARLAGLDPAPMAGRIELGHVAGSTRGNALETQAWARRHAVRSLIVVTAGYHMPRALAELSQVLPEVALYPVPVRPPALRRGTDLSTVRLLGVEYVKFLAARLGLSRLAGSAAAAAAPRISGSGAAIFG